jgi:hypothetical protein
MLNKAGVLILVSGTLMAAAAMAAAPGTVSQTAPTINDSMTKVMAVHAQTIWDTSSKAFNAKGDGLVASKLTAQDWKFVGEAGRGLRDRAKTLAAPQRPRVVGPGERIMGQDAAHGGKKGTFDAASVKQIEDLIDGNHALFIKKANILVKAGDDLDKASKTRDVKTLYRVSANLDEVCDGCHQPFWGTDETPPAPKNARVLKGPGA